MLYKAKFGDHPLPDISYVNASAMGKIPLTELSKQSSTSLEGERTSTMVDNLVCESLSKEAPIVLVSDVFDHILDQILQCLDGKSLLCAERVCVHWHKRIVHSKTWKCLLENKLNCNPLWMGIRQRRNWNCDWSQNATPENEHPYFRTKYAEMHKDIEDNENMLKKNWQNAKYAVTETPCESPVRCLQYDDVKIVTGHDDSKIRVCVIQIYFFINGNSLVILFITFHLIIFICPGELALGHS